MSYLGWGKCRVIVKDLDADSATFEEFPTPVEGSTQLTVTKGDKKEAKIEGGENEDVRYTKNSYALACSIRAAKGRTQPIADSDGVVAHKYTVFVVPEDPACNGFQIQKATVSLEDGFSTEEGGMWNYTFDALKPTAGQMVKWGVVTVTESGGSISNVTIADAA